MNQHAASAGTPLPLEHLGFEVDRDGAVTVHVKQPGQMFGLTLEQALRRIAEFKNADSARILRALPAFYEIPQCGEVCGACGHRHAAGAQLQELAGSRPAPRRAKKSKSLNKETT